MTSEECVIQLEYLKDFKTSQQIEALDLAIKALEKINHLIDRPCEACDLRKENGCCKWGCVFEEDEGNAE